ncbi:MAG: CPBP family intramembrane metalloprotease domain-containing protein [Chloroflexi bacterium HGW-Chloroflexi-6]|nr:MAG: CPBP family intramembrane metalloprotease domain-containing protein [Chloroflexi bacterium HGW-Chloroflexi-6]
MIDKKSLIWFIAIAFGLSWILFAAPLAFKNDETLYPVAMQGLFALGMWGPGIAAIVVTLFVAREPFSTLRLNTLGQKRIYFWAWFIPPVIAALTLAATVLLGTGQFDGSLSLMRDLLAQAPQTQEMPAVEILVLIQIASALTIAPFINILFAMGEELGWRGFLLPKLLPLGQWKALLLSGVIWGIWHAPTTLLHGYNFPLHPYLGVLVMTVGCMLLGVIFGWIYLKTRSPWAPALAHGTFNAIAGISFLFLRPEGLDTALAGNPLGLAGWLPMALVIIVLIVLKQLPVRQE